MLMKMRLLRSILIVVPCLALALPVGAVAQDNPIQVDLDPHKIQRDFVEAPSMGSLKDVSGDSAGKWMTVQFDYNVKADSAFVDEIEFKIYIEATEYLNKDDHDGKPIVLTGDVTYVNIPAKPTGVSSAGFFCVHPNTILRYGTDREFSRRNIHIDALIQGQIIGSADLKPEQDPRWYSTLKPLNGQVFNKDQGPWALSDPSRFPAIKLKSLSN